MIGGNTKARFERAELARNALGEMVQTWAEVATATGWLDLQSGDKSYNTYNASIAESTHIFLCDYSAAVRGIRRKDCRAVIDGDVYDVKWIDDPMGLHQHLEVYLALTGGQTDGR